MGLSSKGDWSLPVKHFSFWFRKDHCLPQLTIEYILLLLKRLSQTSPLRAQGFSPTYRYIICQANANPWETMRAGIFESISQNTGEQSSEPDYAHVNLIKIKPVSCQQTWRVIARGTAWESPWPRAARQEKCALKGTHLKQLSALVGVVFKGFSTFSEENVL